MKLRVALTAVALTALLLGVPSVDDAEAQRLRTSANQWSVELFAGAASPKGDLGDVNDDGQLAGVAVSHWLHPQFALRIEGTFENLERGGRPNRLGGARGPKTDLWHYIVGFEALFTHPARTDWRMGIELGVGGTYLDVGTALVPPGVEVGPEVRDGFSGHELTGRGALIAGYEMADGLVLFARGGSFVMFGDAGDPEGSFLGKEAVFTHELGLRIGL